MPKSIRSILLSFYFFSGATSLLYEVVWVRYLETVLGSSTLAVACILAAFMSGLSLGSLLAGHIKPITQKPVLFYGLFELGVGLYAVFFPWIQEKLIVVQVSSVSIRYFLSLFVILAPATFMGATFPVISNAFLKKREETGSWIGILNGLNTLGASMGVFITGFILIEQLGLFKTNMFAAIINAAIGCLSVALSFSGKQNSAQIHSAKDTEAFNKRYFWLGAFFLFLSGISTMIYEILWTRFLTLVLGSSTYAFSIVLITLLLGLALGNLFFTHWIDGSRPLLLSGYIFQILLCFFVLLSFLLQDRLPLLFFSLYQKTGPQFWKIEMLQFILSSLIIFLPSFLIGASFPCFMKIGLGRITPWRKHIGSLYSINTLGSVLGSIAGSLILLPLLGLQNTIKFVIGFHLMIGILLIWHAPIKRVLRIILVPLTLSIWIVALILPSWNLKILTSGTSVYAQKYTSLGIHQKKLLDEINRSKILFSKDGWTSHVTVREYGGVRSLLINGKADGSDGIDIETELLIAHMPLLIHPSPQRVFVVGLGTGITLRAVEKYPVHEIDCVEIEKRVVEASRFFKKSNHRALSDPRLDLAIDDARHVLSSSNNQSYDVIISEPSNPWLAGIGSLYSVEMFRQIDKHLNKGGLVCQWIHYYNMSPSDLKTVVRTFQSVFPNATLWAQAHLSDLFLIGIKSDSKAAINPTWLENKKIANDLRFIQMNDLKSLESLLWLNSEELKNFAGSGVLNSDDHPILEFSAPRYLYQETMSENLKEILKFRSERQTAHEQAMTHWLEGMIEFYNKSPMAFLDHLTEAVKISPYSKRLLSFYEENVYQESQILFQKGLDMEALDLLSKASTYLPRSFRIFYSIGFFYQKQHEWEKAKKTYLTAIKINPKFSQAHNNLGAVYLALGHSEKARRSFRRALELDPFYLEAHLNLANALLQENALEGAELQFRLCLKLNPNFSSAYNGLGVTLALQKKYSQATEQFKKSLEVDPENTEATKNLERCLKLLENKNQKTENKNN